MKKLHFGQNQIKSITTDDSSIYKDKMKTSKKRKQIKNFIKNIFDKFIRYIREVVVFLAKLMYLEKM